MTQRNRELLDTLRRRTEQAENEGDVSFFEGVSARNIVSPEAALVDSFLNRISSWRNDDSTVEELLADLDRTLGHRWFRSNEDHGTVALGIARLRDTIAAIGGLTMNERLFTFDLLDRWDPASA